jgi:NhaP-type Na+/H+ or K+/H+ antiporter
LNEEAMISLASIVVLGIGAQWLAWRLHLPSILLLLLAGFLAGPITGMVNPDELLGETLFPVVSISVGIILFEGGLTLKLDEITGVRRVIVRLISVGALITWAVGALAAYVIIDLDFELAVLVGAIFVVSGPTVVMPLIKHVRPGGQVGSILKWEGILIDPVGATLAVLVFEVILAGQTEGTTAAVMLTGLIKTVVIGGTFGIFAARVMILFFKRQWVPDYLQNPIAVMMIVASFTAANELQTESGLLTTTLMGVVLANQKTISVKHVTQFKEDLGVLLLSSLFVILAARLELESLSNLSIRALVFLAVLIFIGRPLAVYLSTLGSRLSWRERVFLAWLAPRGIVAVSVASLFALELSHAGKTGAERLVPLTFLVVVGTVAIYGLSASLVARRLGLVQPYPQGVLIVGAQAWAQHIARALHNAGRKVLLIDTNYNNIRAARMSGLPAMYVNALSDKVLTDVELNQMGYLLALTSNDEVNSLAALRFAEIFGHSRVYQLPLQEGNDCRRSPTLDVRLRGRCLFRPEMTHAYLSERFDAGAVIKTVKLSTEFGYNAFRERYGATAVPLFVIDEEKNLVILTTDGVVEPRPGQTLIGLVDDPDILSQADDRAAKLPSHV